MTTTAQLRKAALELPGVEEGMHFGMVAFTVRGKGFAGLDRSGKAVQLQLSDEDAQAALGAHRTAEALVRRGTPIGIRVPLADINGKDLNDLVFRAWRHRAPKRLAAVQDAAAAGEAPAGSDLPQSIGKPATRALLGAGITTRAQVAEHTDAELLALHGVGPKAVRILRDQQRWPVGDEGTP